MSKIYRAILRRINKALNLVLKYYVKFAPLKYGLNKSEEREKKIIVSLASYNRRYSSICPALKSLLLQTVKPDKIIVWLDEDNKKNELTPEMQRLKQFGIEYRYTDLDLKPHKKYFYVMQEFPADIIITVDDDCIYSPNLIKSLMKTYRRFPNSICARRVHKMTFDEKLALKPYDDWIREIRCVRTPSFSLCAIGNGGILYPPALLPPQTFDLRYIQKYFINTDDLWLKTMELINNVKVVWAPTYMITPPETSGSQVSRLFTINQGALGNNNKSLEILQKEFPQAFEILKK